MGKYLLVSTTDDNFLDTAQALLRMAGAEAEKITINEEAPEIVWHANDKEMLDDIAGDMKIHREKDYDWIKYGELPDETMEGMREVIANSYEYREENHISEDEADDIDELLKEFVCG